MYFFEFILVLSSDVHDRLMSTSLKVVSMAVVFFASTNLREIVLRRLLIFSAFHFLKMIQRRVCDLDYLMQQAHHLLKFFLLDLME